MAKFKFKLQTLLNLKHQLEESKKNEMGQLARRLEEEKRLYKKIEEDRENYIKMFSDESQKGMTVSKIRDLNRFISVLKERLNKQQENVNLASENVEKCREELIQIVKEREMLEKLKEKKFQQYIREELRKEQLMSDEVAGFRYMNRNND